MRRDAERQKLLDGIIEELPIDAGQVIVTSISRFAKTVGNH